MNLETNLKENACGSELHFTHEHLSEIICQDEAQKHITQQNDDSGEVNNNINSKYNRNHSPICPQTQIIKSSVSHQYCGEKIIYILENPVSSNEIGDDHRHPACDNDLVFEYSDNVDNKSEIATSEEKNRTIKHGNHIGKCDLQSLETKNGSIEEVGRKRTDDFNCDEKCKVIVLKDTCSSAVVVDDDVKGEDKSKHEKQVMFETHNDTMGTCYKKLNDLPESKNSPVKPRACSSIRRIQEKIQKDLASNTPSTTVPFMATALNSYRRQRSRSRASRCCKTLPTNVQRPYRRWLGVSTNIFSDSRYIVASRKRSKSRVSSSLGKTKELMKEAVSMQNGNGGTGNTQKGRINEHSNEERDCSTKYGSVSNAHLSFGEQGDRKGSSTLDCCKCNIIATNDSVFQQNVEQFNKEPNSRENIDIFDQSISISPLSSPFVMVTQNLGICKYLVEDEKTKCVETTENGKEFATQDISVNIQPQAYYKEYAHEEEHFHITENNPHKHTHCCEHLNKSDGKYVESNIHNLSPYNENGFGAQGNCNCADCYNGDGAYRNVQKNENMPNELSLSLHESCLQVNSTKESNQKGNAKENGWSVLNELEITCPERVERTERDFEHADGFDKIDSIDDNSINKYGSEYQERSIALTGKSNEILSDNSEHVHSSQKAVRDSVLSPDLRLISNQICHNTEEEISQNGSKEMSYIGPIHHAEDDISHGHEIEEDIVSDCSSSEDEMFGEFQKIIGEMYDINSEILQENIQYLLCDKQNEASLNSVKGEIPSKSITTDDAFISTLEKTFDLWVADGDITIDTSQTPAINDIGEILIKEAPTEPIQELEKLPKKKKRERGRQKRAGKSKVQEVIKNTTERNVPQNEIETEKKVFSVTHEVKYQEPPEYVNNRMPSIFPLDHSFRQDGGLAGPVASVPKYEFTTPPPDPLPEIEKKGCGKESNNTVPFDGVHGVNPLREELKQYHELGLHPMRSKQAQPSTIKRFMMSKSWKKEAPKPEYYHVQVSIYI